MVLKFTPTFNYTCMYTHNYTAIEVNGEHIINGDLTIVRSGHYSADGDDYDYYRASTEVETVSSTGPLVNPVTLQVCTHIITLMHYNNIIIYFTFQNVHSYFSYWNYIEIH